METDTGARLEAILSRYSREKNNLIPILQAAQEEFRYLPLPVMQEVSRFLRLPESAVFGVATFYAQFKFTPVGKHIIRCCRGTACHVRGAPRIVEEVGKQLNIEDGGTTDDMEYSLETIACFGSCALAPVMVVDDDVYGRMTPVKVREILGGTGGS